MKDRHSLAFVCVLVSDIPRLWVAWQDQEQSENSEDAHLNWTRIRGIEAWPFPPFFLFLVENGIGLVSV